MLDESWCLRAFDVGWVSLVAVLVWMVLDSGLDIVSIIGGGVSGVLEEMTVPE